MTPEKRRFVFALTALGALVGLLAGAMISGVEFSDMFKAVVSAYLGGMAQ